MAATPFLGIAYQARSRTLASQRLINLFPEVVESKSGAAVAGFYGCPGLVLKAEIGTGPIRGMLVSNGLLYVVTGNKLYSVTTGYVATLLGTLGTSTGQVSMISNPTQVAVFDSVTGYSVVAGVFAAITLPFPNPGIASYQDGFGLINQVGTFNVYQSNLNDLTTWQALNFTTEDGSADNVVATLQFHNQVVIFKENHLCFYINAGNPGFSFQRLQGVYPQTGCIAPYSCTQVGETVVWLGKNSDGVGTVYAMRGYEPARISTHALEYAIAQYPTITDAIGFAYTQEGHKFYVLTFPSGGETWVMDLVETKAFQIPAWHQRAAFLNGQFTRYWLNETVYFAGDVIGGDYANGNIYALDLDNYTDNGSLRKYLRSWPAAEPSFEPQRYNWLELLAETGIGVPPGTNPLLVLRYSDDGGYNWSAEIFGESGATGQIANRISWKRLGQTRRGINSQRIFELSTTDQMKIAWLGAEVG